MDYSQFFSADVPAFLPSPVREIFRTADLESICSFAGGYPSPETFPLEEMPSMVAEVLRKYGAKALQYGATQGVPELREALARRYGVPVSQVQVTTSSQQGIDVCTRVFVDPGDRVLANAPVYLGALQSFSAYRARVCGIQVSATPSSRPAAKFIYVIPDFNNPSGRTMTLAEREALVQLARERDLLIVEDSPYRELRYSGEPLPAIRELAPERTLHLGSFSKIFAPGFRIGWIIGPEPLLEKIYVCKQCLDLCPPVLDQYLAAEFLGSGALDRQLQRSIDLYRRRRDRMLSLLEQYMPAGVSWTHPEGGLFLWLTLPESIDTVALYSRALAGGVAYVAGSFFYPDGSHRNTMRLNFSFVDEAKMEAGIRTLASLLSTTGNSHAAAQEADIQLFTGAGNSFVVIDGRDRDASAFRETARIQALCRQHGTDGLMILGRDPACDFSMEFYNPDGSGGMMCGNGGRCIVAFADSLGIRPGRHAGLAEGSYLFRAPDGLHTGEILSRPEDGRWEVRIKMVDVHGVTPVKDGFFLDTGTRHFVRFIDDVDGADMEAEAKPLRWDPAFAPVGTNVNFVEIRPDGLHVRTFEKGVEGETLACGTGLTASAIAAWRNGVAGQEQTGQKTVSYRLQCRRGDWLEVRFTPAGDDCTEVYLTGPAERI